MTAFAQVTTEEITKIIKASSKTTCSLDPMPTKILIDEHLDEISPVITDIVNRSIQSGKMPPDLKSALVRPLLKKSTLDQYIIKNYRPVSNLSFLSNLIRN